MLMWLVHLQVLSAVVMATTKMPPHHQVNCPDFHEVPNGRVTIERIGDKEMAVISCLDGFDLEGTGSVYCDNGEWAQYSRPQCFKRCPAPPFLKNGALRIEGAKDEDGMFRKGALASYSCPEGYILTPPESEFRVCERGIWTGAMARCLPLVKVSGCESPKSISNGYYVLEKMGDYELWSFGQRLHYSCNAGYTLDGSSVQQCLEDGSWSPRIQPECVQSSTESTSDGFPCRPLPKVPYSVAALVQGVAQPYDSSVADGTIVEVSCEGKYRSARTPCEASKLVCFNGKWNGILPICERAYQCVEPPRVPDATLVILENFRNGRLEDAAKFRIKTQITYQCAAGYVLQGNEVLTCQASGCWAPEAPVCLRGTNNIYLEVNSFNAIFVSAATGSGVLGLLLAICLYVVCKRRKPLSRGAAPLAPSSGNPQRHHDMGDHAALLHQQPPDRLALIAFADGMQQAGSQTSLPSYDEATRERNGASGAASLGPLVSSLSVSRLPRPHFPNLTGIRRVATRNTPSSNPDTVHITRHGSFASHTPSTLSAGDSMGSTDTVAVSEGSTNVTLDTASSHSGSQPASCRVHCGSLASFDTSSVINTEDVPLLEESELEEIQTSNNDLSGGGGVVPATCTFKMASSNELP